MALNSWLPMTMRALPLSTNALHDLKDAELLTATVDEVAYVDGLPLGMRVGSGPVIHLIAGASSRSVNCVAQSWTSPTMS